MIANRNELKEFADAIAVPLFNSDGIKWPVRSGPLILNVGDILATEYYNQLKKLFLNNNKDHLIATFPNSVCVWRTAHHTINGLKKANYTNHEIAEMCSMLIILIKEISGNKTLFSKQHLISHNYDLEKLKANAYRKPIASIKKILYLSSLLWAYSESLYFQAREICCEYHGLYRISNNQRVLIREYKNLFPDELWKEIKEDSVDISSITIITYHKSDFEITIDAYNNVAVASGDFFKSCVGFLLFINGHIEDIDEMIDLLLHIFSKRLERQVDMVMKLSKESLYKKYIEIFWYRKKNLAKLIGEDWTPPLSAYEIIKKVKIEENKQNPYRRYLSLEEISTWFDYSDYL